MQRKCELRISLIERWRKEAKKGSTFLFFSVLLLLKQYLNNLQKVQLLTCAKRKRPLKKGRVVYNMIIKR